MVRYLLAALAAACICAPAQAATTFTGTLSSYDYGNLPADFLVPGTTYRISFSEVVTNPLVETLYAERWNTYNAAGEEIDGNEDDTIAGARMTGTGTAFVFVDPYGPHAFTQHFLDGSYTVWSYTRWNSDVSALVGQGITSFTISAIPEPSTWAMMLVGFGAIGLAFRRKRQLQAA